MRTLLTILILILAAPTVSAALVTQNSALNASLLYYEPVPAQSGDLVTVWIQINNNGGQASNPGEITIYESPVFAVSNEAERVKEFPRIPARESFLAKVDIRVSRDASEGEHNLRISVQQDGSANSLQENLPIEISGRSTALSIASATVNPDEVLPGEDLSLDITILNVGETRMRNLNVELDLSDLSLAPISGSNAQTIGSLSPGSEHVFSFALVSFPETEAKAYQVPIMLTYEDERGNEKIQEETVGIIIGAHPELLVYFDSIEMTTENMQGEVVIRLVNKGLSEIKLAEIEIIETDDVQVTSETPVVYVGNIDEDDYESADITLRVAQPEVTIPVRISYRDALNRQYEEERELPLRLSEPADNGSNWLWISIVILAIAIGGWVWWKRRR